MKRVVDKENPYKNVSPLTEGRGLKHATQKPIDLLVRSPLTEGRGLKPVSRYGKRFVGLVSPLTEGRGLKLCVHVDQHKQPIVAPHGGAWIETL